jgi:hypothetical protein
VFSPVYDCSKIVEEMIKIVRKNPIDMFIVLIGYTRYAKHIDRSLRKHNRYAR